jgi:murein DD-endopeptidase MepM/ murein hydrolase activator NlpD
VRYQFILAASIAISLAFNQATRVGAAAPIVITLDFEYLRQGTAGVIQLSGPDIQGAKASALGHTCRFFAVRSGYACLMAVPMDQRIKDYPLDVMVSRRDGSSSAWQGTLKVASGQFIAEPAFNIPSDKFYLLRADIEASENSRLEAIYSLVTPERFWGGAFVQPVAGALTSPFGSVRSYNDGVTRRHTGYDLRAPTGTPVIASSNGRVVFARPLDIHGQIVVIDHGWGIFSSYSHLSQIYVVPGQFVLQGDVVGSSGNTGRSLGPHVHWEIAVGGTVVDPAAFARLKLPS